MTRTIVTFATFLLYLGPVYAGQFDALFDNRDFEVSKSEITTRLSNYQRHNNNFFNGNGTVPGMGFHSDSYINLMLKDNDKITRISEGHLDRTAGTNKFRTVEFDSNQNVRSYTLCNGKTGQRSFVIFNYWSYGCQTVTPSLCRSIKTKGDFKFLRERVNQCKDFVSMANTLASDIASDRSVSEAASRNISHINDKIIRLKFNTRVSFDVIATGDKTENPGALPGDLLTTFTRLSNVVDLCERADKFFPTTPNAEAHPAEASK